MIIYQKIETFFVYTNRVIITVLSYVFWYAIRIPGIIDHILSIGLCLFVYSKEIYVIDIGLSTTVDIRNLPKESLVTSRKLTILASSYIVFFYIYS
jgi:hypothetical protein